MPDFRQRSRQPELMDGEDVSQEEFAACITDLAMVNSVTLGRRPTLDFIRRALRATPDGIMTILDVGFGAGDMLRAIRRQTGPCTQLIGIDLNPRSEPVAREMTPPSMEIEYRTGDVFAWPQQEPVDIVISSAVTHHMDDAEILRFIRWMEVRSRLGWYINDLHRHWFAYYGFGLLSAVMRWHRFVRHDGPLSVSRAFRREDWESLLEAAGVGDQAVVSWWFPFRYCVERAKW